MHTYSTPEYIETYYLYHSAQAFLTLVLQMGVVATPHTFFFK